MILPAYKNLVDRCSEIALLDSAASLLSWDQETYMPPKALDYRASQLSYLSASTHRLFIAPEVGDWIQTCEQAQLQGDAATNVREWRKAYDRATKLPVALVEEFHRVCTFARDAWVHARQQSDFPAFSPHLQKILELSRQMAEHWGYQQSPYDALLEAYETGVRAADLRQLFQAYEPALRDILEPALGRAAQQPKNNLHGTFPVPAQQAFNARVAAACGFDFKAGRIDTTTHPFCTGLGPSDCRLTTRYDEKDFTESLYGILHEAGHGMYDQGLRTDCYGLPAGSAVSLGIHESQSRLWENHVGRNRLFWNHWHPIACEYFPDLKTVTPEQLWAHVNRVEKSFIRVEADELTYDLHILLRFEIELQLIEQKLDVKDVPAYWNQKFAKAFGLQVPKDAQGCLQDIHWSLGSFGYFPTYTLGNLNSSQLFAAALDQNAGLQNQLAVGDYGTLLKWLREHVHQPGKTLLPAELMKSATGRSTDAGPHLAYLRQKFIGA